MHILHIVSEPRTVSKGGMEPFQDYKTCKGKKRTDKEGRVLFGGRCSFHRIKIITIRDRGAQ